MKRIRRAGARLAMEVSTAAFRRPFLSNCALHHILRRLSVQYAYVGDVSRRGGGRDGPLRNNCFFQSGQRCGFV